MITKRVNHSTSLASVFTLAMSLAACSDSLETVSGSTIQARATVDGTSVELSANEASQLHALMTAFSDQTQAAADAGASSDTLATRAPGVPIERCATFVQSLYELPTIRSQLPEPDSIKTVQIEVTKTETDSDYKTEESLDYRLELLRPSGQCRISVAESLMQSRAN